MKNPLAKAMEKWRKSWTHDRLKHRLGCTDDEEWDAYIDSFSNSALIWHLSIYLEDGE